ncbi:MAG TPA: hypothetical protein VIH90_08340 [Candidatus Saccharimonadales bacterium]
MNDSTRQEVYIDPEDQILHLVGDGMFTEAATLRVRQAADHMALGDLVTAQFELRTAADLIDSHLRAAQEGIGLPIYVEAIETLTPEDSSWVDVRFVYADLFITLNKIREDYDPIAHPNERTPSGWDNERIYKMLQEIDSKVSDKDDRDRIIVLSVFFDNPLGEGEGSKLARYRAINQLHSPRLTALAQCFSTADKSSYRQAGIDHDEGTAIINIYRSLNSTEQVQFFVDYLTLMKMVPKDQLPPIATGWNTWQQRIYRSKSIVREELAQYTKDLNALFARCGRDVVNLDRAQWQFPTKVVEPLPAIAINVETPPRERLRRRFLNALISESAK